MKAQLHAAPRSSHIWENAVTAPRERTPRLGTRLVLAHPDPSFAGPVGRQLLQLGWEVHAAATSAEARRLAETLAPAVVVAATDLPDESGWLLCAKLRHCAPSPKVILVSTGRSQESYAFTDFVGADALVGEDEGAQALIDAVQGERFRAVG